MLLLLKAKSYGRSKRSPHRGDAVSPDRAAQLDAVRAQDRLKTTTRQALDAALSRYRGDTLDKQGLKRKWQAILRQAYRHAFANGLKASGQTGELTDHDDRYLRTFRQQEWGYLRKFLDAIFQNKLKMPLERRLDLYQNTLDAAYWAGRIEGEPEDVKIHWTLSPVEHCSDCISLAMGGPYTRETLPLQPRAGFGTPPHGTQCGSNCRCFLVFEQPVQPPMPLVQPVPAPPEGFVSPFPSASMSGAGVATSTHRASRPLPPAPDIRLQIRLPQILGMSPVEFTQAADRVVQARQTAAFPSAQYRHLSGWIIGFVLGAAMQARREQDVVDLALRYRDAGVLPLGGLYSPTEVWTIEHQGAGWQARTDSEVIGVTPDREEAYQMLILEAERRHKLIPSELRQGQPLRRSHCLLLVKSRKVQAYRRVDPKTGQIVYVKEHTDRRDPAQMQLFLDREKLHLTKETEKRISTSRRQDAVVHAREEAEKLKDPPGKLQVRGELKHAQSGVSTIALGMSRDLIAQGRVDLRGHTIKSAEDLATVAQVYRHPGFETFRIFYTKGDKIVAHEGVTSRLPGAVDVFPEGTERRKVEEIKRRMQRLEADGYYLLHNHPGGDPTPSKGDLYVTERIARSISGFKGHVVIDGGQYALMEKKSEPDGGWFIEETSPIRLPGASKQKKESFLSNLFPSEEEHYIDPLHAPEIPHAQLGRRIDNVIEIALLGEELKTPSGMVTLLYLDSRGRVRAIQEAPVALFQRRIEMGGWLRRHGRDFGSDTILAYHGGQGDLGAAAQDLIDGEVLSVFVSGNSDRDAVRALGPASLADARPLMFGRKVSSVMVAAPKKRLRKGERLMLVLRKSRKVQAYRRVDPKTGQIVYVKEHTDRRDPAQMQLFLDREKLHLTGDAHHRGISPGRGQVEPRAKPAQRELFPAHVAAHVATRPGRKRTRTQEQGPTLFDHAESRNESPKNTPPTLENALHALASVDDHAQQRDSAGFGKFDVLFAHGMAAQPEDEWSPKAKYAVWRMLRKYRKQLAGMGIDFDKIPAPPDPAAADQNPQQKTALDQYIEKEGKRPFEQKGPDQGEQPEQPPVSPEVANMQILADLMQPKGISVQMGTTDRGNAAIEIGGNTYPQLEKFQEIKNKGVTGGKNSRGKFAWWTTHGDMPGVITHFGGTPYDTDHSSTDTPGRGTGPEGLPGTPGGARDNAGTPTTGLSPGRGDDGIRNTGRERADDGELPEGAPPVRGRESEQLQPDNPDGQAANHPRTEPGLTHAEPTVAELLAAEPPEPKTPLREDLAGLLVADQQADVRLIADAKARGERGFLLGNGTGTGKTFVAIGVIKQMGSPRTLIVVPNQGIGQQWRDVGSEYFGVDVTLGAPRSADQDGIFVTTYSELRKVGNQGKFGITIFDEVHRDAMKLRTRSKTAMLIADTARSSGFAIYSTATPIEKPQDAEYLFPLGLWDTDQRTGFIQWAKKHGVQYDLKDVPMRGGGMQQAYDPKFIGHPEGGPVQSMAQIRSEIVTQGKGVFRELKLDIPMHSEFTSVPTSDSEFSNQVRRGIGALKNLPDGPIFAAARTNITKRLLDYVKLDAAVEAAVKAVESGHAVPVFVSNVSPFNFRVDESDEELKDLGMVAQQIRQVFADAGLSGVLPSPVDLMVQKLRDRLGADQVEAYTGQVAAGKRKKINRGKMKREDIKQAFNDGKVKVIVATIAAGGTGLSLHDTVGDRPRYQINVGLPWSGKDFQQLLGRTYRHGTKSPVTQHFLFTEHPAERRLAAVVGGKVEAMGATTRGITSDTNTDRLAEFSLTGMFDTGIEETNLLKSRVLVFRAQRRDPLKKSRTIRRAV